MPAEVAGQIEMAAAPEHELAGKDVAGAEKESKASEPAAPEKDEKGQGKKGEKGGQPKYSMHTGDQVAVWLADTEVEFVLDGKRPGTKSYDRYAKYSQGKTIKGVLDAGAKPEDLLNDFERELFKVTGGPLRDAKLDPATITAASSLNDTEIVLLQLLNKCQRPEGADPAPAIAKINQLKLSANKSHQKKDAGMDNKKEAGKEVKKTILKHTGGENFVSAISPQSVDRRKKDSAAATVGEALSLGAAMPAEAAGQIEMAAAPEHELAGKDVAGAEKESKASEPAAPEKDEKGQGKKGEKGGQCKYSMHTGDQVAVWLADTEVEFVLDGKRPGTKSYDRYAKYSQAKTIKGVLDAGALPEDLLNDFEKKLFKVTGGPLRDAKLDPATITDASSLNDTEIVLLQLLLKCQRPEGADLAPAIAKINQLKLSKKYGVDATALRKSTWAESPGMMAERLRAAETAAKILNAAETEKRKITHADVLQVLRLWRFRKNGSRVDVMPEGTKTISCDRLGVQRKNGEDINIASQETLHYPQIMKLFSRWLKDNPPAGMDFDFPFTSMFVNGEYAARRHRDKANMGPTVVASFGDFTDGRLGYWAEDDKSTQIVQLDEDDKEMLDIRNTATLIDGNRAHAVEEWLGTDRFSLVFYVLDQSEATSDELKKELVENGCVWPTEASLEATKNLLPAPKGYTEADAAAPRRTLSKLGGDANRSHHKKDAGVDHKKEIGKEVKKTVLKHTGCKNPFSVYTTRPAEFWTSQTRLMWLEGKEGVAPRSVDRHKKYSAASTVGEALSLGAKPTDLLHDFEVRLMKPHPRGPTRTVPLRLVHVRDRNALDKYLMSMKAPLDVRATGLRLMSSMGRRMAGGTERVDQSGQKREMADELAAALLKDAEATGRRITDREVHEVLSRWTFHRNDSRQNVLPDGATFVYSDTLGLVHTRTGTYAATRATKDHRNVVRLLTRWLKDRRPSELEHDFPFTSISLNAGYAAKRHRDGNNAGPSMIRAFGRYNGGQLGYWPEDNKSSTLENLQAKDRVTFDLAKDLVLFDGNRAHEVDDFQGERFSVVYFTTKGYDQIPEDQQAVLKDCGFPLPTAEDLDRVWPLLPEPRGYEGQRLEKFFDGGAAGAAAPPKLYTWHFPSNPEEEKAVAAVIKAADRPEVAPPVTPDKSQKAMLTQKSGQKGKKPASAKAKLARIWGGPLGRSLKKVAAAQPAQQKSKPQGKGLKRKADGTEADALSMMQEGLASLVKAAKNSEGGVAGMADRLRPQLMKYMQEVLRFAGSE